EPNPSRGSVRLQSSVLPTGAAPPNPIHRRLASSHGAPRSAQSHQRALRPRTPSTAGSRARTAPLAPLSPTRGRGAPEPHPPPARELARRPSLRSVRAGDDGDQAVVVGRGRDTTVRVLEATHGDGVAPETGHALLAERRPGDAGEPAGRRLGGLLDGRDL